MRIGEVLRKWRRHSDLGVREAAKQIGLSVATLSRVERGAAMDAATLAKIICWLLEKQ
jgi:transcriptional regulator with XRE-family HTH domain